jgi:hypothetical protein
VDSSSPELGSPAEPTRPRDDPPRLRFAELPVLDPPPWLVSRSVVSSPIPAPPPELPDVPALLVLRERDERLEPDEPDEEERPRPELPPRVLVPLRERVLLEPRPLEDPRPDEDDERLEDPERRDELARPVDEERLEEPRLDVERPRPPVERDDELRPPRLLAAPRPRDDVPDDERPDEDERPLDEDERPPDEDRRPVEERPREDDRPPDDERDRLDEDRDRPLDEPPWERPLPERLEPFRLAMTYPPSRREASGRRRDESSPVRLSDIFTPYGRVCQ